MQQPPQSNFSSTAQWLVSDDAAQWLTWLRTQDLKAMAPFVHLRQHLSEEQAAAVRQQADLRKRGERKFAAAQQMFFTDIGLQQSTDEQIATYKAGRFPAGAKLADLCCGIGGDLIALAQKGPTTAIDASAEHLRFAEANVRAHGAALERAVQGLAEETSLADFAAWHIDPDRRASQQRTVRLENFSPTVEKLEEMLARNPNAALKLAPASVIPPAWDAQGQCEWITHHRECKQLVVWLGSLCEQPGSRTATRIGGDGQTDHFTGFPASQQVGNSEVQGYLFDPDPSLVASGLLDTLAEQLLLSRVASLSQYLTGTRPIAHPLLQAFEVLGQEKIDPKRLKRAVSEAGWGVLELKQRGLELNLPSLRKQLKPRGAGEGTIIFTPTLNGNRAIFCRRVSA